MSKGKKEDLESKKEEKKKLEGIDEEVRIFETEEEELMRRAPADLLKKERPDLLEKDYGRDVKVNPPTSGGKKLKKREE